MDQAAAGGGAPPADRRSTSTCDGTIVQRADPDAIADAIVRVHEAGMAMRESTAHWFAENAERLSLESSLRTVLTSYGATAR
jgi:hypothetical protein